MFGIYQEIPQILTMLDTQELAFDVEASIIDKVQKLGLSLNLLFVASVEKGHHWVTDLANMIGWTAGFSVV